MNDDIANLLNQDWLLRPQMRFYAAKVLAGAILVNPSSLSAIMINTIEVYGRTSIIDAHCERSMTKKKVAAPTTNPPIDTRYCNVWVVSMNDIDGSKLNISTKTFNGLVTSSMRLDANIIPELGAGTSAFDVDEDTGRQVQIFLDAANVAFAAKLANNERANNIHDYDHLQQLRQVRSKFSEHSTYIPSRASSSMCNFHRTQPQTIFTYCSFDNGNNKTDGKLMSKLFAKVALAVLMKKDKAVLEKTIVSNILSECSTAGRAAKTISKILSTFSDDRESITILNNTDLDTHLKELATFMTPYLTTANDIIKSDIQKCYR